MSFLVLSAAAGPCVAGVPGDLVISELADGTLPGGLPKWVELTNCGPTSHDLAEYSLGNFNNGAPTMGFNALVLSGTVDAGGSYVISFENGDQPGNSVFYDVYGFDADNLDQGAFVNGDDVIVLFLGAALAGDPGDGSVTPVVDVYGVVGVDGSGEAWEYTDGFSFRRPGASPTAVFDESQWVFGGANSLEDGNDAVELELIRALTTPAVHSCELPTDLMITEICDATLPGGLPKWVEVSNCGADDIDLQQYSMARFNNGSDTASAMNMLAGILGAGESYVVSYENGDAPGNSVFYDVYGFDADNMDPGNSINGDDAMVLFYGPVVSADMGDGSGNPVVDVYGVVGVDGTGEVWEYIDGYSRRNPDSTATAVFDPAQWFFGGANSLEGANDDEELLLIQTLTFPGEHDCGGGLALDIKPGGCPNPVNRGSQGYLPVALAGSSSVDISEVNPDSILLSRADGIGGAAAPHEGPTGPHTTYGDVATPFDGDDCDCLEDEGDGLTDLMMHFDTPGFVDALELDDFEGGEFVEIQVDGTLIDGTEFSATDCIRLVPPTGGGLLGGPSFGSDGVVNNDELASIVVSWNQGDAGSGPGLGGLVRVIERWGLRP